VIVGLGGAAVADVDDLQRLLGEGAIGRSLRLELLRLTEKRGLVVVPRESGQGAPRPGRGDVTEKA